MNFMFSKLRSFINKHLIADVPPSDARCIFECENMSCTQGRYETCQLRIDYAKSYAEALKKHSDCLSPI